MLQRRVVHIQFWIPASSAWHDSLESRHSLCVCDMCVPVYYWIVFHGCTIFHFHQFPRWGTFGWFPVWDSYTLSCFQQLCLLFCVYVCMSVCEHKLLFYPSKYPRIGMMEHETNLCLNFRETAKLFGKWLPHLTFVPTGNAPDLQLLRLLASTRYGWFKISLPLL